MYEPPIKLFETPWKTIVEEKEDAIFAKIQSEFGIDLDKKELIRALQYDRNQYKKGYAQGMKDAVKWIPVTERLPELIPCNAGTSYSEAVIVWTDNRKAMIAVWDGIDFLCAADYWEAWGENITHWMPLPEPPKDEV